MNAGARPLLLGGRLIDATDGGDVPGVSALEVLNKFSGAVAGAVAQGDVSIVERAIELACDAAPKLRAMPAFERRDALAHVTARVEQQANAFAHAITIETGKPLRDAEGEVARAVDTFRLSAEEATRLYGEFLPLDISPRGDGYEAVTRRVPVGPVSLIVPFNFPLNLAAHKIGPAIAAGCPFLLKPDPRTPLSAAMLGQILAETNLPTGACSILPCTDRAGLDRLVTDDRLRLLSFTGSCKVGWQLRARAHAKRVVLELGGNAACIVDEGADLDHAVARIVAGAFSQAGQSCISVQRILAHRSIHDALAEQLTARIAALVVGDPLDEATNVGPLISENDARRVEAWIREAIDAGARVLTGNKRDGALFRPTLLAGPDPRADVAICREEIFGPVAMLWPFEEFDDAIAIANATPYGLQAGVFTRDLGRALRAWDELEVGGVVIGDIPSMRVDSMPYGGVKRSGLGREGVRYAIQDMTEPRLLVLNRAALR